MRLPIIALAACVLIISCDSDKIGSEYVFEKKALCQNGNIIDISIYKVDRVGGWHSEKWLSKKGFSRINFTGDDAAELWKQVSTKVSDPIVDRLTPSSYSVKLVAVASNSHGKKYIVKIINILCADSRTRFVADGRDENWWFELNAVMSNRILEWLEEN